MQQSILIILHQEHSTPGRVGNALRELGYAARRAPAALRRSAAADHGGSCRRHHLRRPDERQRSGRLHPARDRLDRRAAAREQAVSSASVSARRCSPASSAAKCSAILKATPRSAITRSGRPPPASPSSSDWPECVYQWHREGFDLPRGAELLAAGDTFEVQAIRYGSGYRAAISSRRDPRHDAQVDDARPRPHAASRRQAARQPFCRSRGVRLHGARVAQRLPRALVGCRPDRHSLTFQLLEKAA